MNADEAVTALAKPDFLARIEALEALEAAPDKVVSGSKVTDLLKNQHSGVRASAAVAIGNCGEKAAGKAEAVAALLQDGDEDVSWTVLQVGGGSERPASIMRKPKCGALYALGCMASASHVAAITEALDDPDYEIKMCAVEALANIGSSAKEAAGKIAELMDDETYKVRAKACYALGVFKADDQVDKLSEMLEDSSQMVRAEAVYALGQIGEPAAQYAGLMAKLLLDVSNTVRSSAVVAIANVGEMGHPYASLVATLLNDPSSDVRAEVCTALGKMGVHGAAFEDEVSQLEGDEELAAVASAAVQQMKAIAA
mmetsp:Transcript_59708/g.168241  ORF Transcript_59708/g.168241 Transcript_59708/m.168241 type:complete len:312 (+) Transcript_59708:86-1021(+)